MKVGTTEGFRLGLLEKMKFSIVLFRNFQNRFFRKPINKVHFSRHVPVN